MLLEATVFLMVTKNLSLTKNVKRGSNHFLQL